MDEFLKYWPVALVIGNGLGWWVMWSLSRKFVGAEACAICRREIDGRLHSLEVQARDIPDAAVMQDIRDGLADVAGALREQSAKISGLESLIERVERPLNLLMEHHLREDGK